MQISQNCIDTIRCTYLIYDKLIDRPNCKWQNLLSVLKSASLYNARPVNYNFLILVTINAKKRYVKPISFNVLYKRAKLCVVELRNKKKGDYVMRNNNGRKWPLLAKRIIRDEEMIGQPAILSG